MGQIARGSGHRGDAGFTLVELILVVGIIGVLASIALPNFRNFQARARQSEAKIGLAALYTAEAAYFTEQESFTTCLTSTNFTRVGDKLYYAVGFSAVDATCGLGADDCHSEKFDPVTACPAGAFPDGAFFVATVGHGGAPVTFADFTPVAVNAIAKNSFTLSAAGRISGRSGAPLDVWTINQAKSLVNTQSGL